MWRLRVFGGQFLVFASSDLSSRRHVSNSGCVPEPQIQSRGKTIDPASVLIATAEGAEDIVVDENYGMSSPEIKKDSFQTKFGFTKSTTDNATVQDTSVTTANDHPPNYTILDPAQQAHPQVPQKHKPFHNTATLHSKSTPEERQQYENYYSEEEKAKLRAKGVNPALKAEMEIKRKESGGGFMSKFFASGGSSGPGSLGGF